jgi:ATP phosphoribosyltransferase
MVIIALPSPNSKLHFPVLNYLTKKGINLPPLDKRELYIKKNQDALIYSRGWDIPILVNNGIADLGITGIDVVSELSPETKICEYWPVRKSRIVIATHKIENNFCEDEKIIVTEYPSLTKKYLESRNLQAKLIPLRGAAESVGGIETIWGVVTLVTSGETLRKNNLIELETLMETDVCLISSHKINNPSELFWNTIRL